MPDWVGHQYSDNGLPINDGRLTILDLEVLDRGLVQVQGVWAEDQRAVAITQDCLSLCVPEKGGFIHFQGYGDLRGEPKNRAKLPVFSYDGAVEYSALARFLAADMPWVAGNRVWMRS